MNGCAMMLVARALVHLRWRLVQIRTREEHQRDPERDPCPDSSDHRDCDVLATPRRAMYAPRAWPAACGYRPHKFVASPQARSICWCTQMQMPTCPRLGRSPTPSTSKTRRKCACDHSLLAYGQCLLWKCVVAGGCMTAMMGGAGTQGGHHGCVQSRRRRRRVVVPSARLLTARTCACGRAHSQHWWWLLACHTLSTRRCSIARAAPSAGAFLQAVVVTVVIPCRRRHVHTRPRTLCLPFATHCLHTRAVHLVSQRSQPNVHGLRLLANLGKRSACDNP